MTALDAETFGHLFLADLRADDLARPRSTQATLGVSSVGHCRRQASYVLAGVPPTDASDSTAALLGTMIHEGALAARKRANPDLLIEAELKIDLPNGLSLLGHADEIDPDEPSVTDLKTTGNIGYVRKHGASLQQRYQRHLYALGAIQAGLVETEGLLVRNLWLDRTGADPVPHVEQEPFSLEVVAEAAAWLGEARDAALSGSEAPCDKDYSFCRSYCQWFTRARGTEEPDAGREIADPELCTAAALHREASDEIKEWTAVKEGAAAALGEAEGRTRNGFKVRRVFTKSGPVSYERQASFSTRVERLR